MVKMLVARTARRLLLSLLTTTCIVLRSCHCWQQWNFSSYTSNQWRETWMLKDGPFERRGHTLLLFNKSKVILFGGRGNDAHRKHVPKRFNLVEDEEGVLDFESHNGMPLGNYLPESPECQPVETCVTSRVCSYSWEHLLENDPSPTERAKIEEECGFVPVGTYYNDVWSYDTDCLRYGDLACANDGWRILHPGLTFGGCNNKDGKLVCETPSERYGHGAAMLDERTMAVYGGYSQECEDYCDDFWLFDLVTLQWTKVETPVNPGNRHEFAMVSTDNRVYIFGGHRLWEGYGTDNIDESLPKGGYLDDLWMYGNTDSAGGGPQKQWVKIEGRETCVDSPGLTWESRNDVHCQLNWPSARSGHASVYDEKRGGIWVHGGYSTYYPYPTSRESGRPLDAATLSMTDVDLLPTYAFYLDDLWFYHIETGYWEKKRVFGRKPQPRTKHILALSGDILVLHGGFGDNVHFDDTWHYKIEENRYLEKVGNVHADYSETCVDDLAAIQQDSSCIELEFPPDLKRSNESTFALKYQEILPFREQDGFTPDHDHPFYFGIVHDANDFVQKLRKKYLEEGVYDKKGERIWLESTVPDGTPIAPRAATAPRQFARQKTMKFNTTTEIEVWEWCISAAGEPTRDKVDDGLFGRSNTSVLIPQPRRQSPGWDGCRDVKWVSPSTRADHASVYVDKYDMLVTHGGMGNSAVLDDLWVLNMHDCARNCSDHGVCTNGYCECDPGYSGIDCSNVTCPGSVCEYRGDDHSQHCTHCCYDSIDGRKVPCKLMDDELMLFTGTSEGICDGFGTCQCAPPYIGEDCSIRDCKNSCSFNGYCIVEFPQSRCMCKAGYTGEFCQHMECLNNCSYPNGMCNQATGQCTCKTLYSPYNVSQPWNSWQGHDCSYLPVWSASSYPSWKNQWGAFIVVAFGSLLVIT